MFTADQKFGADQNQNQANAFSGKFGPQQEPKDNDIIVNHSQIQLNNLNGSRLEDKDIEKNAMDTGNFNGQIMKSNKKDPNYLEMKK